MDRSTSSRYFEQLYAETADPWAYATAPYERRKYSATLSALPRRKYARAFEPGCSVGVLTRMLADRCRRLLAVDVSEASLDRARARCRDKSNIRFQRRQIPAEWPNGTFDLIVLSELLYYQSTRDCAMTARKTSGSLRRNGVVLLVNWLGKTGTARSGDDAVKQFIRRSRRKLRIARRTRNSFYRLDMLAF